MERKFLDFSLPRSECSTERKLHGSESSLYGLFAPGNESAEERKGQLPLESRPFRSSALSFPGAKSPQRELLLPWNFRSVEHSLIGTFAPVELSFLGSERSKSFRSTERFPSNIR